MSDASFYKQNTLPDFIQTDESGSTIPQTIGPYKIDSLLNKGGMSLLYLGIDPETKQALAVKVLSPAYVNHPEATERFLKEAKIISLSNHPNIVKVYGHGQWAGGLYIAMELIRGVSLRQFIMQQSLSLKRTLDIILQVSYALLHLHTHGVIHRDLKPENILITEDGEIKVIDFGIAMLHTERTQEVKRIIGTPHYMSPEQKENPMGVTFATDIYALGIITYELVLGKLSYGIVNPTFLPKGLRKIIEKAMAISLKERYTDIVEFISDISLYIKSGEWEKERSGTDQTKELLENLQEATQPFSSMDLPEWNEIEIGVSRFKNVGQMGLYYDFFHFPNNTYGVLLSLTSSAEIDGAVYSGILYGQITAYIEAKKQKEPFSLSPEELISFLSNLYLTTPIKQQFALHFILLDPLNDELKFCTAGLSDIYHFSRGGDIKRLNAFNPSIGKQMPFEMSMTTDSWNVGDSIILHTLNADFNSNSERENEEDLFAIVKETILLPPQAQADALMKKIVLHPAFAATIHPKAFLSLQRTD